MTKKVVKAWAVVSKKGVIQTIARDGWNFHLGIFKTRNEAREVRDFTGDVIARCTIHYEI